jgi:hypothetical protein
LALSRLSTELLLATPRSPLRRLPRSSTKP